MKHGRNPTVAEKKLLKKLGLNYENWLISRNNERELVVIHRLSGRSRTLIK